MMLLSRGRFSCAKVGEWQSLSYAMVHLETRGSIMATMNVSLPDQMKDWVGQQVANGRYANSSDYVRDLIRRHKEREEAHDALMVELQKGLDSGISKRSLDEIWESAKAKARAAKAAKDAKR